MRSAVDSSLKPAYGTGESGNNVAHERHTPPLGGDHFDALVPRGDYKRARGLKGLRSLIAAKGGDPAKILARFGFDLAELDNPDSYLPYTPLIQMFEHCAETLDAPFFGFELGREQSTEVIGPLALLLLSAPTLEEGLSLVARYMTIHAPGARLGLEREGDQVALTYQVREPAAAFCRQINEMSVTLAAKTLQTIAGPDISLSGFDIASDPPPKARNPIAAYFGAEVCYGQPVSAVRFPAHLLKRKLRTSDSLLLRLAQSQCDALMPKDEMGGQDLLEDIVIQQVQRLLPMGQCNLANIARQLGIHPRSLQYRLTEAGVEFRELVRQQRQSLAEAYLSGTHTSIADIATLLGYSDQAVFTRAFSVWVGTSPRRYRAANAQLGRRASASPIAAKPAPHEARPERAAPSPAKFAAGS